MSCDKHVVLAYSGGLDTSVILKWLVEKSYNVVCFCANLGQEDDFDEMKERALAIGAKDVVFRDLRREFIENYVFPAVRANAVYEGRYLLGTALARPLIAQAQLEVAKEYKAQYVAHGATGKGNDQVRFELSFYSLCPSIKVISPWKDEEFLAAFKGRKDMIAYAEEKGIPIKASIDKPYSEDANLLHISHEAGILEDPAFICPKDVYSYSCSPKEAPDEETSLELHFKDGTPVLLRHHVSDEKTVEKRDPYELFLYLCQIGGENGVGRVDMVENRFVGIKSRGVYETPGGTILYKAHSDLESIAMDREVMRLRNMLSPKVAELIYNGFWFSPEMDFLMAAVEKSQEFIDGKVTLSLYKGNIDILARESSSSLYDQDLSSMDIEGGFDQRDSKGFIEINAIRLKAHRAIVEKLSKK